MRGEAAYPFTDAEKIGNIAVLEAICRSAASGAPVRVADAGRPPQLGAGEG